MKQPKLFFLISFFSLLNLSAQKLTPDLFTPSNFDTKNLSASSIDLIDRVTHNGTFPSKLVHVNKDIIKANSYFGVNTSILSEIPNVGSCYIYLIDTDDPDNWYADIRSDVGHGSSSFMCDGGYISAFIYDESGVYELFPVNPVEDGDLYVLVKTPPDIRKDIKVCDHTIYDDPNGPDHDPNTNGGNNNDTDVDNRDISTIDFLFLPSDQVNLDGSTNEGFGNLITIARFEKHLNTVLKNSDIQDVKVNLITVEEDFAYTENPIYDMRDHLDELTGNQQIEFYREQYGADIALVLLDMNGGDFSDALGISGTIDLDDDNSFAIIQMDYIHSYFTGAHEFFHIFDCGHEWGSSQDEPYQHAKLLSWWSGKEKGTLMNNVSELETLKALSNPDVDHDPGFWYNEQPTGSSVQDNARRVEEAAPIVADYRPASSYTSSVLMSFYNIPHPFYPHGTICKGDVFDIIQSSNFSTPSDLDYHYEYSTDGVYYYDLKNNPNFINLGFNYSEWNNNLNITTSIDNQVDGHIYFKLTITHLNTGVSDSDYCVLTLNECNGLVMPDVGTQLSANSDNEDFRIYPNPSSNGEFSTSNINNKIHDIHVFSLFGKYLGKYNLESNRIDLSHFINGTYTLMVSNKEGEILDTKRIILNHN